MKIGKKFGEIHLTYIFIAWNSIFIYFFYNWRQTYEIVHAYVVV